MTHVIQDNEPQVTTYQRALDRKAMTPWELADPIFRQIAVTTKGKPGEMKAALAMLALQVRSVEALESIA